MTPKQLDALKTVAMGIVVFQMKVTMAKAPGYYVTGVRTKAKGQPQFIWLRTNGYITHAPSMRPTSVTLTRKALDEFPDMEQDTDPWIM